MILEAVATAGRLRMCIVCKHCERVRHARRVLHTRTIAVTHEYFVFLYVAKFQTAVTFQRKTHLSVCTCLRAFVMKLSRIGRGEGVSRRDWRSRRSSLPRE